MPAYVFSDAGLALATVTLPGVRFPRTGNDIVRKRSFLLRDGNDPSNESPYENVYGLHLEVSLPRIGFPPGPLELLVLLVEPRFQLEQLRRHVNAPLLVVLCVFREINFQLAVSIHSSRERRGDPQPAKA